MRDVLRQEDYRGGDCFGLSEEIRMAGVDRDNGRRSAFERIFYRNHAIAYAHNGAVRHVVHTECDVFSEAWIPREGVPCRRDPERQDRCGDPAIHGTERYESRFE